MSRMFHCVCSTAMQRSAIQNRSATLRLYAFVQCRQNSQKQALPRNWDQLKEAIGNPQRTPEGRESLKMKAVGWSVLVGLLTSQALLLWRRYREVTQLNEVQPPISFEEFSNKYLAQGNVDSIHFKPNFKVADVFLLSEPAKEGTKRRRRPPSLWDNSSRAPDVRFQYEAGPDELEKAIMSVQKELSQPSQVIYEVDSYPSYG
jgi:hypothetical protein